jgi:hypothetical protein
LNSIEGAQELLFLNGTYLTAKNAADKRVPGLIFQTRENLIRGDIDE